MKTLDINDIRNLLPHRYPFLLVDRVIELEHGKSITAIKNVSYNEPYFLGHFPVKPVMPGVLIIEALAQAAGLLAFETQGVVPDDDELFYLVGVDKARFKQPVYPGDQLMLQVEIQKSMRGIWKFSGAATVDGKLAASADLMCAERGA